LTKQQELRKTNVIGLVGKFSPGQGQGCRGTLDQLRRPFEVVGTFVPCFQRPEQRVVVEPVRPVVAVPVKIGPEVWARPGPEVGPGRFEQAVLERGDNVVINDGCRE
jgi:hypothetical protein